MSVPYILLALLIFGFLIFIHELGHFLVARACGVTILEFAIGMGPKLFSIRSKKSGTLYSIRLFPIGGYVNMYGEKNANPVLPESKKEKTDSDILIQDTNSTPDDAEPVNDEHSYANKSVFKRILISLAGPLMNILLGFLLMLILVLSAGTSSLGSTKVAAFYTEYTANEAQYGFMPGDYLESVAEEPFTSYRQIQEKIEASSDGTFLSDVTVLRLNEEKNGYESVKIPGVPFTAAFLEQSFTHSKSESSGLLPGDVIKKVGSVSVHTYNELSYEIMNQGESPVTLLVERDGSKITLSNVSFPTLVDEGSGVTLGDMDFRVYREQNPGLVTILKHTFFRSLSAIKMVWDSIGGLLTGRFGVQAVSGPVGITKTISDAAKTGALNLLYLVIIISINLGVVNLLPLPALDGGHIFFYLLEAVRGKPIKPEVEGIVNFVGLILLLALAVIIAIKDVISL